jgi:hypothetical protein
MCGICDAGILFSAPITEACWFAGIAASYQPFPELSFRWVKNRISLQHLSCSICSVRNTVVRHKQTNMQRFMKVLSPNYVWWCMLHNRKGIIKPFWLSAVLSQIDKTIIKLSSTPLCVHNYEISRRFKHCLTFSRVQEHASQSHACFPLGGAQTPKRSKAKKPSVFCFLFSVVHSSRTKTATCE